MRCPALFCRCHWSCRCCSRRCARSGCCATIATVLVGLVVTAAFATFAVGQLNLISMAFAVLFCGLGVDFTTQLGVAFRAACAEGIKGRAAVVAAADRVGWPVLLAAAATACGF